MLPGDVDGFKLGRSTSHWKGKSDLATNAFIERTPVSFQHFLHLFLHHLSLEEVALDLHSHIFRFGTIRFTHCSYHVNTNLIKRSIMNIVSVRRINYAQGR